MRHLVSLSLKYLRRQKLRTVLTFLCITLSVFILNSASAFGGSIYKTILHSVMDEEGSWEVNLSDVLKDASKENALDIIQNHVAVDESYLLKSGYVHGSRSRFREDDPETYPGICYYQIGLDGQDAVRTFSLRYESEAGNSDLCYSSDDRAQILADIPEEAGSAIVPDWFRDYGYEVGDTVEISVTPVCAELSEESEQVIAARQYVEELNAEREDPYYITDDPGFEAQNGSFQNCYPLLSYMKELYALEDIVFSNEQPEEPYVVTLTICGFCASNYEYLPVSGRVPLSELELHTSAATNIDFSGMPSSGDLNISETQLYVRTNPKMDMDNALMMLFTDLGYDENEFIDYLSPSSRDAYNSPVYHTELLAWELKGADAIATLIPYIALLLILIAVLWFVARFVIDNAFEISVQERSSQFAVLRIMGASRRQLIALVFTEAVAYCLLAIPAGALTAFLSCRYVMERFHALGFDAFTFYVNPYVTVVGICLSVIAIFISAYTSAMWAARKLSPIEALQYGKPRKKKEKIGHRAQKLNRKSKNFIRRYTLKNILRTKQRFLVATIAMTLGVMLFTFCALLGTLVTRAVNGILQIERESDFVIHIEGQHPDAMERADEIFGDSDAVTDYYIQVHAYLQSDSESVYLLYKMLPEGIRDPGVDTLSPDNFGNLVNSRLVTREYYTEHIEPLTHISYDIFSASGAALLYCSPYVKDGEFVVDEKGYTFVLQSEDGWYPNAKEITVFTDNSGMGSSLPILGVICYDDVQHVDMMNRLILPADTELFQSDPTLYTNLHITVNGGENLAAVKELISEFTGEVGYSCFVMDSYIENTGLMEFIGTIITTAAIFLFCIWLVGVLSMVNSVNTSVLNRQNELIMMRAVGMTKRQLMGTVLLESVLFSGISTVIGLVLGVAGFLASVVTLQLGDDAAFFTPLAVLIPAVVLLTLALNLAIAALAALPGLQSLSKRLKSA